MPNDASADGTSFNLSFPWDGLFGSVRDSSAFICFLCMQRFFLLGSWCRTRRVQRVLVRRGTVGAERNVGCCRGVVLDRRETSRLQRYSRACAYRGLRSLTTGPEPRTRVILCGQQATCPLVLPHVFYTRMEYMLNLSEKFMYKIEKNPSNISHRGIVRMKGKRKGKKYGDLSRQC
jgi:hypothetical protein